MSRMPWLASYPAGVRWDRTLAVSPVQDLLEQSVARWRDNPALEFLGRQISYGALGRLTDQAAKGFQQLGVAPGCHVGLFLPNTPHYIIAFFGILKAGGTVVNYSPLDAAKVLEHKIEDSQTDFILTLDLKALYPQMAGMLGHTRLQRLIVGKVGEMMATPDALDKQLGSAGQIAEVTWNEAHLSFASLLDNDGDYQRHAITDPGKTVAVLQYTGGTTGLPKGAMLTHANLTAAAAQYAESNGGGDDPVLVEGQERFLAVLPPFHIYALTVNMLFGLRLGAEIILQDRFDPRSALEAIANRKVSVFCGVPTMFTALISHPETGNYNLKSLKFCGSGGAPLPVEIAGRYLEITGCPLAEGWGMTETSPTGTFSPANGKIKAGSCGIPLPGIDLKMLSLDDPTRYVKLGERGEICIRGPNVMKGYWNKPEATAEVTTFDGYMRTGDVAYMDDEGYVFIVDRCKDMLLCSGFNVYPRVLEEAIYLHPAVREVSVIGIPDAYRGQSPKAFVSLKAGASAFDLEQLQAFLRDKVGKHEMIQALEIRDELPKTAVGKLSKKALVDEEAGKRESKSS